MMLIASHRHSARDLAHWRRLERYDAVLARSADLARREARALDTLRAFAARGPCYVGVSWGKDSVVVAHLAWRLYAEGVRLPVIRVLRPPYENPDCDEVEQAFLARWPVDHHRVVVECERGDDGKWWAVGDRSARPKQVGFARAARIAGSARYVSGVRGEESSVRELRMARWGEATATTCAPIGRWRGEHVFAYLAKYDLPVHPAYAQTLGGTLDRIRLRVGSIGGSHGTGHGRAEWERHYYRDVVEAMAP